MEDAEINQVIENDNATANDTDKDIVIEPIILSSPSKPKRRKTISVVWDDFEIVDVNGTEKAKYIHCKKLFSCPSTQGTSHLIRHLTRCPIRARQSKGQQLLVPSLGDGSMSLGNFKFNEECSHESLAKMIIMHEYPFKMVEHIGFMEFAKTLQPQFKMVKRNTIKTDCIEIYMREKGKLKNMLKTIPGRISLTSDMWTSNQTLGYMSITAHFIDDNWKLHKRILNFRMVPSPHTANVLTDIMLMSFLEWGIEEKIFSLTLDNCTTNDLLCTNLIDAGKNLYVLDGRFFHIRCSAHILNIIVQKGLTEIKEIIGKIRESIKYVMGSQARKQKFDEVVQQVRVVSKKNLCLDVQTRWNSTYLMLDAALEFRHAFSRLETRDTNYTGSPSVDDWKKAKSVSLFLEVFYNATNVCSGTNYPTANLYFHEVWKIQVHLLKHCNSEDLFITNMAKVMQGKFDKYWKEWSVILAIALVLDPRFKMQRIEYCFGKVYGNNAHLYLKDVEDGLHDLYHEYVRCSAAFDIEQGLTKKFNTNVITSDDIDDADYDEFINARFTSQSSKSELEIYLEEPPFPRNEYFDILDWWKVNSPKYVIVSMIARDILAIPISTVPSESAFSTGGRVLDQFRSSLCAETVEALICAQDWLRKA